MGSIDRTRASWNFATRQHNAHKSDQAAFLRGNSTLFEDERTLVGNVSGKRLLHVLCNSGQDSLSWAREGALVTGVDLSDEAIAFAERLSAESGIAGTFVRSEACAYLEAASERFDIVFGSYGCLPWIEDLARFFAGIRRVLNPGGHVAILEFHPLVWSFDESFRFTRDAYFTNEPFVDPVGDYVGDARGALSPSGHIAFESKENPTAAISYQHTVSDIVNAIVHAGLPIEEMVETPYANGCKVAPGLVRDGARYIAPDGVKAPPLMLGIRARKMR